MTSNCVRRLLTLVLASTFAAAAVITPGGARGAQAAAQPDLAISYDMSQSVQRGQPFTFKVQLTNQGQSATENGQYYAFGAGLYGGQTISSYEINSSKFSCEIDHALQSAIGPVDQILCKSRYAFEPDEQATLVVHAVASARPGQFKLICLAILQDEPAPDADKKNNRIDTTVQVN